ncbi:hypothetical protein CDAR_235031 [Caerostris darwini]|uniref:Uncharacterized protein n=1 Tax=Caerostris darwini TaxID=1538125 RepID=A0AAV4WCP0_9ARAC|nr:hypothetical protein CDAR_235031 [Caerostris darwini]
MGPVATFATAATLYYCNFLRTISWGKFEASEIDLKLKQVGHPVLAKIINIPTPQAEVILVSDSRCFDLVFALSEKKGKPLVGRKWQCRNEWEGKRARTDMEFHRRLDTVTARLICLAHLLHKLYTQQPLRCAYGVCDVRLLSNRMHSGVEIQNTPTIYWRNLFSFFFNFILF